MVFFLRASPFLDFCIWYIWCHILVYLLYNNCLCILIVLIFSAVQCHSHMEHFFLLYRSSLNPSIFLYFTPCVTVCILLSLMTVFSPRGFGFSSTAIFFFSSFHYTHCHPVTGFLSCLLFSLTANNLFFISGLYRHVFISFLNANFSCHLRWWRFLFSPDFRSSADAVSSPAQSHEHCVAVDVICHLEQYSSFECLSLHLKVLDLISISFTLFVLSSGRGVASAYHLYKLV